MSLCLTCVDAEFQIVFFVGAVSDQMLANYYRTADVCVFPAIYGESFGIVLLEAMACGKPIVAFANSGYKEILKDRAEDCLVEPKERRGLSEKDKHSFK